ncbi:kinase-like protein [Xylaria sp. FL0043]|nr:kinase-like protein [Xylaria sp. FL0043]
MDPDVIALIFPLPGLHFDEAHKAIKGNPQWKPARLASGQPTSRNFDPRHFPYLEIRLSNIPRQSTGLMFGADQGACDVLLPNVPSISRRHFALTYKNTFKDKGYRLVLRDLGSRNGTAVSYNKQPIQYRSSFDWIIDGFSYPDAIKSFVVDLLEGLAYKIIVNHDSIKSPMYAASVQRFRRGRADAGDLINDTRLTRGPETEGNTPLQGPIILDVRVLAEGGNGVVHLAWNVSNGEEYACKEPKGYTYNTVTWKEEVRIMKRISHRHIVKLLYDVPVGRPRLYLEYMPCGSLLNEYRREPFLPDECSVILLQTSSALQHLHEVLDITHRDLKLENILVKYRDSRNPSCLHVKVTDFGLSKDRGAMKSRVGTNYYMAPEIMFVQQHIYTKKVDIWSLGAVILQLRAGFPAPVNTDTHMDWCTKLVGKVAGLPLGGLFNILRHMLVITPEARYSAHECFQEAQKLLQSSSNLHGSHGPQGRSP